MADPSPYPRTADEVREWFLYWRTWLHNELVDSLEASSGPTKDALVFAEHDGRLHQLMKAAAIKLVRIDLLEVLSSRAEGR